MVFLLPPGACTHLTIFSLAVLSICAPATAEDQLRLRTAPAAASLASKPLFTEDDFNAMTYEGGFRMPDVADNKYSGGAIAYYLDGSTPSLYTHVNFHANSKVMQISIPARVDTSNPALMNRAGTMQAAVDLWEGNRQNIVPVGGYPDSQLAHKGLLVHNGRLISSIYDFYNNGTQRATHASHSLTLATASHLGFVAIWSELKPRFAAGGMCDIPAYAQSALGGYKAIAAGTSGSIISTLSVGHAAFAFNPDDILTADPLDIIPNRALMYFDYSDGREIVAGHDDFAYPNAAGTGPGDPTDIWNRATMIGGCFIPEGTRSLIYVGVQGSGDYCYGAGTSTLALHETLKDGGPQRWCYNPLSTHQGDHAYPYRYQMWAFDLLDLIAAHANGTPWSEDGKTTLAPYDWWELDLPTPPPTNVVPGDTVGGNGVAYDRVNKRLFYSQFSGEDPGGAFDRPPVFHTWTHP